MSFLLLPLLLTVAPIKAQHAEKTLVKSFNLSGQSAIFLDLAGDVKVTTWKEPQMRIQMTITLQNGSETMLKSLVTAGRYNLNTKVENDIFSIVAPGLDRQIKLGNGQLIGEQITYEVFAPEDMSITFRNAESIGLNESTGSTY
jgi:hypothetical protein